MGGSKSTSVQVPQWLEDAGRYALARSQEVSRIPFAPYYGPDVAAMTPTQLAAMQGTNAAASAFGLATVDPTAGMAGAQNYGGMAAYSSAPLYDQALIELQRRQPGTYNAIMGQFIDPITGEMPMYMANYTNAADLMPPAMPASASGGGGRDYAPAPTRVGTGTGSLGLPDPMSGPVSSVGRIGRGGGMFGGYTGLKDMFDGGGPGKSGSTFKGGGRLSDVANAAGAKPVGSREKRAESKKRR